MPVRFFKSIIVIGIAGAFLSGCTSMKLSNTAQTDYQHIPWQKREQGLKQIQAWQAKGAFSIQQDEQTNIAAYEWVQEGANYDIRIHSSLNLYSVIITGKEGEVSLSQSSNKTISAHSPEELMKKELGWSLPLQNLSFWMRGLPGSGAEQTRLDEYGHLVYIRESGWTIQLSRYKTVGKFDLPQLLLMKQGNLKAKIVIKQWALR